ncbi:MAG: hypothetical protein JXR76_04525 [Deltaproteobacteria bacterium]|nr:hypothetical protein [Deltaproteobacteria bacterium]
MVLSNDRDTSPDEALEELSFALPEHGAGSWIPEGSETEVRRTRYCIERSHTDRWMYRIAGSAVEYRAGAAFSPCGE